MKTRGKEIPFRTAERESNKTIFAATANSAVVVSATFPFLRQYITVNEINEKQNILNVEIYFRKMH